MKENGTKRREWVKTAAIIFLSVLLVLTFFSNTIMNYSLPEVATQYVQSGTITAKIRGTGIVESGDPYNVMIKETRKVTSVAVRAGDQVQAGDVLVYLEDSESEELKAYSEALETAQDALEEAWKAYDRAFLAGEIDSDIINQLSQNISTTEYRNRITAAQNARAEAQKQVDDLTARVNAVELEISRTPSNNVDTSAEEKALTAAKTAMDEANFALTEAQNQLASLERQLEYANSVSGSDAAQPQQVEQLLVQIRNATVAMNNAQTTAANAKLTYDRASTALDNKVATGDTTGTIENLNRQKATVQAELDIASANLAEKEAALQSLLGDVSQVLGIEDQLDVVNKASEAVNKAQKEYDEQRAKSMGSTVVAEIAGTVTSINAEAGKEVSALDPVAVLQPEGKGYSMSFSVTNDQARRLSVGDVADLVNSWRYDDLLVQLASIKPDTSDPGQRKLLTFDVDGDVTAGQSLSVSVGQRSANYDMIVPNSAIREDNNGKFILIVETRQSPLGNRYIASRVDVEVLASDDTQSAVTGALYGYEFVITTSNQPVEAGKQVRLADN